MDCSTDSAEDTTLLHLQQQISSLLDGLKQNKIPKGSFDSPERAQAICHRLVPGLWENVQFLCASGKDWASLTSLRQYTFSVLLQLMFLRNRTCNVLPINLGEWLNDHFVPEDVHQGLSNSISFVAAPRTARESKRQRKETTSLLENPQALKETKYIGVLFTDELVKDHKHKYGDENFTQDKILCIVYESNPPCTICTKSGISHNRLALASNRFGVLLDGRFPVSESSMCMEIPEAKKAMLNSQTYFTLSSPDLFPDRRQSFREHFEEYKQLQHRPTYQGKDGEQYMEDHPHLLPFPGHGTYDKTQTPLTADKYDSSDVFVQNHVLSLLQKNHEHISRHFTFHVSDSPILFALLKAMYSPAGHHELQTYKQNLCIFAGPLHAVKSLVSLTLSKYGCIILLDWRYAKYCRVRQSSKQCRRSFEESELKFMFTELGRHLLEFSELRMAWSLIRQSHLSKLVECDHPLASLVIWLLEELIPLCLDLIPAYKSSQLDLVILIWERMAAVYIHHPSHHRYRAVCLYMAAKLRRLTQNKEMSEALTAMLPDLLDVHIETFFGHIITHLNPRRTFCAQDIKDAAENTPAALKRNRVCAKLLGFTRERRYYGNLNPESRVPKTADIKACQEFLSQWIDGLVANVNEKCAPIYLESGELKGYKWKELSWSENYGVLDIKNFPFCAQRKVMTSLCGICQQPLHCVVPSQFTMVRQGAKVLMSVTTIQCKNQFTHHVHSVCYYRDKHKLHEDVKEAELRYKCDQLKLCPLGIKEVLINKILKSKDVNLIDGAGECTLCTTEPEVRLLVCAKCEQPIKSGEKRRPASAICKHIYCVSCLPDNTTCPIHEEKMTTEIEAALVQANSHVSNYVPEFTEPQMFSAVESAKKRGNIVSSGEGSRKSGRVEEKCNKKLKTTKNPKTTKKSIRRRK